MEKSKNMIRVNGGKDEEAKRKKKKDGKQKKKKNGVENGGGSEWKTRKRVKGRHTKYINGVK